MQELIKIWAKKQDYATGVELYRRYGSSSFLLRMFEAGESEFNRDKLLAELSKFIAEKPKLVSKEQILTVLKDESKNLSERNNAPEEIKEAIKRRKYLYASSREKHSNLKLLAKLGDSTQEARRLLAVEILEKFVEINEKWNLTSFFDKTGRLPTKINLDVDFSGACEKTLNAEWLKNYKYVKRAAKISFSPEVISRIKRNELLKEHLIKIDAFYHEGLTIPTIPVEKVKEKKA